MNRLTQRPPEHVTIGGLKYKITTDFRVCLQTVLAQTDKQLTENEKRDIFLHNLYAPDYPPDPLEAIERGVWFMCCGREPENKRNPALMSFQTDAEMICAAYLKAGINLDTIDNMHWWTFMSMLSELPESLFNRVVYLRSQRKSGMLSKDERKQCDRIGWDIIDFEKSEDDDLWNYIRGEAEQT